MPAPPLLAREALSARGAGLAIVVLRLGAMGDIVRTLPAVRLVRRELPEARIVWVAFDPWTKLLAHHPDLNGVVAVPRGRMRALARSPFGWPSLMRESFEIVSRIRAVEAGLVLDFHGDLRTGVLGWLSGAPMRVGYEGHQQKEGNRFLTTHRVPAGERRRSRIERNLDLLRALGLPTDPLPDAGLSIDAADRDAAREILKSFGLRRSGYAVINPGASKRQAYKKPPASLLAAAVIALGDHDISSIVVCGPGEEADAERVVAASKGLARLAPPTTLMGLAALLDEARVFVGGDSGPLHLACGVGCPVVALYGPTDPLVNSPWNVPFVALSPAGSVYTGIKSEDRVANGFDGLSPEAVAGAIGDILALRQPSS